MIQFNGNITEKDYTDYLKTHLLYSTSIPKMMIGTILIWPTMEIIDLISAGKTHAGALVITFILISLMSGVIIASLYYVFFKFSTPKTIKGLREGDLFDEKEYVFTTEEIVITSTKNKSFFSWESIRRIRDKNDSYYCNFPK